MRNHDYRNIARIVGKIGKKGEVRVEPIDDLPFLLRNGMEVFFTPPRLTGIRHARVERVEESGDAWLVKFAGCDDSPTAFELVGRLCLVSRADLPELSYEDDPAQLIGLPVFDRARGPIGAVVDVMANPVHLTLVVEDDDGLEVLIPFVDEYICGFGEDAFGELGFNEDAFGEDGATGTRDVHEAADARETCDACDVRETCEACDVRGTHEAGGVAEALIVDLPDSLFQLNRAAHQSERQGERDEEARGRV